MPIFKIWKLEFLTAQFTLASFCLISLEIIPWLRNFFREQDARPGPKFNHPESEGKGAE